MLIQTRLITLAASIALTTVAAAQDFNNIEFIQNKGQWDSRIKYKGDVSNGEVFVRSTGFTIVQHNPKDYQAVQASVHDRNKETTAWMVIRSHAWDVDFVGGSPNMQVVADKPAPGYNNYFSGSDPSKWASECKIYQAITLKEVYPNVDVRYYTYNGMLKYDIIVRPGADIRKIALKYQGASVQVKNKELVLGTSVGDMRESYPYTYKVDGKGKQDVECKYVVKDNVVRFDVKNYDPTTTLVIDPTLIFCSFSGSKADNWGYTATYGPDGSFFGGGIVFGAGFPTTTGAYQTQYFTGAEKNPFDIGIIKLSANGGSRIYATYIGGEGSDQPHSLVVDNSGNVTLAGRTNSPLTGTGSYPVRGAVGIYGKCGGYDIVVTQLNASGTDIIGSKRIGGAEDDGVNISPVRGGTNSLQRNYGDDGRSEVILDAGGNVYVASCTRSTTHQSADSNYFTTPGVFQPLPGPATGGGSNLQDGVVLKFSPGVGNLLFSSYLGGSLQDAAYVLSLGPTGDIYVAGGTESTDFPGNHAGTLGPANGGGIDGFVAQISANGSTLIRSTFIGTSAADQVYGIQFDKKGFPYIMGQTEGQMAPINAIYVNPNSKQFIGKLQPDLSAYVYRTVFGTNSAHPNISPTAFLVDRCENVYVSGWGGQINEADGAYFSAGTMGLPVTADAIKGTTDGEDFYFFVLRRDATGTTPLFASFFGQNVGNFMDHVDGGTSRFDKNGVIYQAICGNCNGGAVFPTTPGVWSTANAAETGSKCNLAMVKIAFNLAGVGSDVGAAIGGVVNDTAGCVPLTVDFTDQVRNAQQYLWDFGDGTPQVGPLPAASGYKQSHLYTAVGHYRVMLIAIDPASCNIMDTSYINIKVGDNKADLQASFVKLEPCTAFNYQFNNLSTTTPALPFTSTSFTWNFGDGSPRVVAGVGSVNHTYPAPGTYNAFLVLNDTAYCNYPDSLPIEVRVAANVEAKVATPATGCAPYTASFTNESVGGLTFEWTFGDPASGGNNTSTLTNPTHLYNVPGTYDVVLVANDPNTCNKTDTSRFSITVYEKPTANFSYAPVAPVVNTPDVFTNLSSANSTNFKWVFGDGDSLITASRTDVTHQYNATGTFTVMLIAFNDLGCSDTAIQQVSTIIVPALDVPNAFTPNSNDVNSIVKVAGFGIAKMHFTIYNRWGQKVFETGNRSEGWNGRVKGAVQPMDVYAYTLEVEFFDGTRATKKGDITLIR
jgi:gliding motility-associated-like protein